jgi:hypothetical protein
MSVPFTLMQGGVGVSKVVKEIFFVMPESLSHFF